MLTGLLPHGHCAARKSCNLEHVLLVLPLITSLPDQTVLRLYQCFKMSFEPRQNKMCLRGIYEQRSPESDCAYVRSDSGIAITFRIHGYCRTNLHIESYLIRTFRLLIWIVSVIIYKYLENTFRHGAANSFRFVLSVLILEHSHCEQKTYLWTCVPSEDSDEPAHSRSLI